MAMQGCSKPFEMIKGFVTQTCIRFIHKTAWFPKTIQTACSSAGSWPWARGPRPQGGPPGNPPPLAGDHARKPFLLLPSARPEKKDLFSVREVARIRTSETWAPQISVDKQTEFSFLQNHHCWGGGSHCGGPWVQHAWPGPGGGEAAPSPSVSSSRQLCPRGWIQMDGYRGASTQRHQHSLYKREWVLQANYALFHGQKESKEV